MPALNLFNRRTVFGGDDLQPTAVLTSFAHVAQFFLLLLPVFLHMNHEAAYIINTHGDNGDNYYDNGNKPILDNLIHYLFGNDSALFYNDETCNAKAHNFPLLLYIFFLLSTIHILTSLFSEYIIYSLASIGNPTQPELRNPLLPKMVERKVVWSSILGNITVIAFGIAAITQSNMYFACRNGVIDYRTNANMENGNESEEELYSDYLSIWFGKHTWWIVFILLLASQVVEATISILFLSALLRKEKVGGGPFLRHSMHSLGSNHSHGSNSQSHGQSHRHAYDDYQMEFMPGERHAHVHHELIEEMWGQRCHSFCKCAASSTCYLFGGRDLVDAGLGDYGQIARALADYFEDGGVLDLVPSDIATGFMMLQRRQRQKVLAARRRINDDLKQGNGGTGSSGKIGGEQRQKQKQKKSVLSSTILREGSTESLTSFPGQRNDNSRSRSSSISRSSSLSFDAHNFGNEHNDHRIKSILNDEVPNNLNLDHGATAISTTFTNLGEIPQYQKSSYDYEDARLHLSHSLSILQPMPYTGTLLLPDGPLLSSSQNDATDFLNVPTAAWTLRKVMEEGGEGNYQAQKRQVFNRNDAIDTNTIAEGARFARHSLSIYTWFLYVYMHPLIGPPQLIYNRIAEFCGQCKNKNQHQNQKSTRDSTYIDPNANELDQNQRNNDSAAAVDNEETDSFFCNVAHGNTIGDNCFHAHRNGLLAHSGLDGSDLIYGNFNNKYNQMPYCIVIDHKWQSVVLAIRGTLSLEDCLVDVLVHPDPLDELGMEYGFDGEGQYCHSGVLSCVKYILNDLKRHGILESLLTGIGAPYAHYALRITGHSLGGGCAALLGYVMRSKFPSLRVVAISPPGGFISWRLAIECKDFVTSFVLDSDLVPRLSVHSMEQLRDEVLEMISRVKVPKMQVVRTFVLNGILGSDKETIDPEKLAHDNAQILHSKENIPTDTEFYRQMEKFKAIQKERKEKRGEYRNIELFPPGKMVHLVKIDERRSCMQRIAKCVTCCTTNVGYKYTPVYVDNDDFDEITITPTMGFDHFPNRVCVELERVAEAFGIDTSLGSSKDDIEIGERLRNANTTIF